MKHIVSILIAILASTVPVLAQSVTTTSLSSAISSTTATTVVVASATGISESQWVYIDREAMRITSVSGTTLTVNRGVDGIVSTHPVGAAVYSASPSSFFSSPPSSMSCNSSSTLNLYIDTTGGDMWTCANNVWRNLAAVTPAPTGTILVGQGASTPAAFTSTIPGSISFTTVLIGDGTAAAPSLAFASQTNTGFYRNAASDIRLSINGTGRYSFQAADFFILNDSATFNMGSSADISLARIAAGQLGIRKDSTHGVTLDVATDGILKLFQRDGTTAGSLTIGSTTIGASVSAASSVVAGATATLGWTSRTGMTSPSDGAVSITNTAGTSGVTLNIATDSTMKLFARDGTSNATFVSSGGIYPHGGIRGFIDSTANGVIQLTNAAGSAGVDLDVATDSTLKLFARDGTSAATLQVGTGTITTLNVSADTSLGSGSALYWNGGDTRLQRIAAGQLGVGFFSAGFKGVTLDAATDGSLKIFAANGTSAATLQASTFTGTVIESAATGEHRFASRTRMFAPVDGVLQITKFDGSSGTAINTAGLAFASLPTITGYGYAVVTDSNTVTWGATIAGGGANKVLAFFNGVSWTVAGK